MIRAILILSFLTTASGFAKTWRWACVDCYSSASLYHLAAQQLAPGDTFEWVLIQSHDYNPGFEKSMQGFPTDSARRRVDFTQASEIAGLADFLRREKIEYVWGGMDTGRYLAADLNARLGFFDNPVDAREGYVQKILQSQLLGKYGIPTLVLRDVDEAMRFIDSFDQPEIAIKFNAGAAGVGLEFVSKHDRAALREALQRRIAGSHLNSFEKEDLILIQPRIRGREYYAQTYSHPGDGQTYLTGLGEYYEIFPGGNRAYYVDRALSLSSVPARELRKILPDIFTRMRAIFGPGHIEMIQEAGTGHWYVVENNVRVAGSGIPFYEWQLYGMSQLHLYLLSQIDPKRLERELALYPRRMRQDGMLFIVPAPYPGTLSAEGIATLEKLPTLFPIAPHYRLVAQTKVKKQTTDLRSAAFVLPLIGSTADIHRDFDVAHENLEAGRILVPNGCADTLIQPSEYFRLMKDRKETIRWEFIP